MKDQPHCDHHFGEHEWGFDCKVYPRCKNGVVYCGFLGVYCYKCGHENIARNFERRDQRIRELEAENRELRAL